MGDEPFSDAWSVDEASLRESESNHGVGIGEHHAWQKFNMYTGHVYNAWFCAEIASKVQL